MKRTRLLFKKTGIRILAALYLLLPLLTYGTVFNVTTTTDGNATNQLRGAIAAADAAGGTNTINVPAGTYTLTMGSIVFGSKAMTLSIIGAGSGSTVISMSATNQDRIFVINLTGNVSGVNVTIQGFTFSNGFLTGDAFGGGAILCGGPLNTVNLQNCVFSSNSTNTSAASIGGGAVAMEGGGALAIDQCSFLNNTCPGGNGGALFYFGSSPQSGSLSITNSVFSGNTATGSSGEGGALYITVQGAGSGATSAISVKKNTFTGNKATGTSAMGGAIGINNGFATGNTAFINFNRFNANTAASIPDVLMNSANGNVDVTNNWWGSNASPVTAGDPHVFLVSGSGPGTLTATPWLRLGCTSSAASICGGSGGNATVTASFQTNSAGTTISAANLTALTGVPITFTPTLGSLSGAQTSIQAGGTATVNFQSNGTTGTANVRAVADSIPTNDVLAVTSITVNAPTLAAASTSGSVTVGASTPVVTDASCKEICSVVQSGAQPLSGTVNVRVTVDPVVASFNGQPYLTRHYDIEPTTGAGTATATITLYYLQSEFNAYNAAVTGSQNMLPATPTDNVGKGNFTITQLHGTGTAPGNYTGWTGAGPSSVLITPGASNVVWNSVKGWWEVSFSVTGFSGFFATGPASFPLPVVLESFSGAPQATGVLLTWKVGVESGLSHYEVESSVDGTGFGKIGSVVATSGATGADIAKGEYQFFQTDPAAGNNFYRLKMVDIDGTFRYSGVVLVNIAAAGNGRWVQVLSNPFSSSCTIRVMAAETGPVSWRLADISGKTLWQGSEILSRGANTFALRPTSLLAKGIYLLTVAGKQLQETVKLVKE